MALLVAWWFLYWSGYPNANLTLAGPFTTRAECQAIRQQVITVAADQRDPRWMVDAGKCFGGD